MLSFCFQFSLYMYPPNVDMIMMSVTFPYYCERYIEHIVALHHYITTHLNHYHFNKNSKLSFPLDILLICYSRRLLDFAEEEGIPYVDMMSITFPFYRERYIEHIVPSHHYVTLNCRGVAGLVVIQKIWDEICPDLAMKYRDTFTTTEEDNWVKSH